eukprot:NODE_6308_length_286_cov_146.801688_g5696_i0.p1 GENE.NODE_6308_length_286_cov_146.801688_g5696_i0~~NODE_6308_length_286_cov_146.801688_g5696_i0.p1  ORF type:complete len:56 (-),score=22.84 NODE_6308_length_286_cov_146.801688_g5696_i0:118-255(-)
MGGLPGMGTLDLALSRLMATALIMDNARLKKHMRIEVKSKQLSLP